MKRIKGKFVFIFDLRLNCLISAGPKKQAWLLVDISVVLFCFSSSQNHRLWLLNLRRRSPLIWTGILISPARLQVMHCTHFFKPLTCPVWTVGSMGLGAYSQQLSVRRPFYSGSNDWHNSLRTHYAASLSGFSAQFRGVFGRFPQSHPPLPPPQIIIFPRRFVVTLSGPGVNSRRVLNWVIDHDSQGKWLSLEEGWPPFSQSLQSQRWIQISEPDFHDRICRRAERRVHALWQWSATLRWALRKPDRKSCTLRPFFFTRELLKL